MKTILAPIDFTPASHNAAEYAAALAKVFEANVQLLHIYTRPIPVGNVPEPLLAGNAVRTKKLSLVKEEAEQLKKTYAVDVSGSTVASFNGTAISGLVNEEEADLVVMGRKENRRNLLLESNTIRMIRSSPKPVLIVPEDARFQPVKNIVLAVDFSRPVNRTSFDVFFAFARQFDACIRVLHIEKKGAEANPGELQQKLELSTVLSHLTYFYERVECDDVTTGILDFVHSHPTDLLVMIAHPHSLIERWFGPLHTKKISFATRLPLLVLKENR